MTQDEVTSQILELTKGQRGWTVLPSDDPMTAERGYVVFRTSEDGETEEHMLGWPVFEEPLNPLVNLVADGSELLEFVNRFPDAVSCDDPKRRILGFAHYQVDTGHALICQIRLTKLKATEDQHKGPLLEIRDQKMTEATDHWEQRCYEAAAITGAIEARAT